MVLQINRKHQINKKNVGTGIPYYKMVTFQGSSLSKLMHNTFQKVLKKIQVLRNLEQSSRATLVTRSKDYNTFI